MTSWVPWEEAVGHSAARAGKQPRAECDAPSLARKSGSDCRSTIPKSKRAVERGERANKNDKKEWMTCSTQDSRVVPHRSTD